MGIILLLTNSMAFAVEAQQGVLYRSGTLIESSQVGAAFNIPDGWQGAWPNGSQFFVLESLALKANLFMMFDNVDQQQLIQIMSGTIPLDSGISLQPKSKPKEKDNQIEADYSIVGGQQAMKAFVTGREIRPGFSVAVIAISKADSHRVNRVASQLVGSIKSLSILVNKAASTSQGANSWQAYMRGRYIARYYTGSGYREKEELWLCSDGTFYSSFNSGGFSLNGASGASQGKGRGRWHAQGSISGQGTLVLQFGAGKVLQGQAADMTWTEAGTGGEQWTYQLSLGDKLYLDNDQWLRGKNSYCN